MSHLVKLLDLTFAIGQFFERVKNDPFEEFPKVFAFGASQDRSHESSA